MPRESSSKHHFSSLRHPGGDAFWSICFWFAKRCWSHLVDFLGDWSQNYSELHDEWASLHNPIGPDVAQYICQSTLYSLSNQYVQWNHTLKENQSYVFMSKLEGLLRLGHLGRLGQHSLVAVLITVALAPPHHQEPWRHFDYSTNQTLFIQWLHHSYSCLNNKTLETNWLNLRLLHTDFETWAKSWGLTLSGQRALNLEQVKERPWWDLLCSFLLYRQGWLCHEKTHEWRWLSVSGWWPAIISQGQPWPQDAERRSRNERGKIVIPFYLDLLPLSCPVAAGCWWLPS